VTENWNFSDVKDSSHCDERTAPPGDHVLETSWSRKEIEQNFRKFNFDLAPKVT
jgi:hypothetical protein